MIESIVNVWTSVMQAIVGLFEDAQALFWNVETSALTFMGTLCVIGVSIGIVLLVIGIIQRFLGLRT
ncbi:hypothetical protein J6Q66_02675 [bacterium]|nr:hypothetical protein [bacterium]